MPKVLSDVSARVEIGVLLGGQHINYLMERGLTPEQKLKNLQLAAEEIERLVKVHVVPEADHYGFHRTIIEREFKCSFCNRPWTEKSETYNGGCCAEDEKSNPEPAESAVPA